ncbi:DUF218 domain protein [Aspergillus stella-maris]|uniref:DUF218 domain protein n=1 Tax=Aspergillus stella-maris TaxID=1810926 RepID=UPI003CCC9CEB
MYDIAGLHRILGVIPGHYESTILLLIEPFQRGETPTFMEHARAGCRLLARDPEAILVLSGGATKRPTTDITEGDSYFVRQGLFKYLRAGTIPLT